jgi:hypothetical protein
MLKIEESISIKMKKKKKTKKMIMKKVNKN